MPESNALPDATHFRLENDPHWHLNDPTFGGEVRAACGLIYPLERLRSETLHAIFPPLNDVPGTPRDLPICEDCADA